MADEKESGYDLVEEIFENIETTFKVEEVFNSFVEMISHLHVIVGGFLETVVKVVPPVGLIFSGIGHLATLGKAKKPSKTRRLSQGIKLFTGLGMLAAAVVGVVFPPLGLAMLSVGAGLSLGRTLYKMWRTSYKLSRAKKAFQEAVHRNETAPVLNKIIESRLLKHSHKMTSRKINSFVAASSFALVVTIAVFPPAGLVCAGLAIGLNAGYTLYRARKPVGRFFSSVGRSIKRFFGFGKRPSPRVMDDRDQMQEELQPVLRPELKSESVVSCDDEDSERESDGGNENNVVESAVVESASETQEPVDEESEVSDAIEHEPEPECRTADNQDSNNEGTDVKQEDVDFSRKTHERVVVTEPQNESQDVSSHVLETKAEVKPQHDKQDFLRHEDELLSTISRQHKDTFAERHHESAQNTHEDRAEKNNTEDFLAHENAALSSVSQDALHSKTLQSSQKKVAAKGLEEDEDDEGEGEGSLHS